MSDRSHVLPAPEGEYFENDRFAGLSILLGLVGIVGLVLSFVGAYKSPVQFSFSWLFAFAYFFTLCVGCLFWTIVHHVTDAEWSVVVRRQLENIASLLPLMAVFFLPVLIWRKNLYQWMNVLPGTDPALDAKHAYLNVGFFVVRSILYFVILAGAAVLLGNVRATRPRDLSRGCRGTRGRVRTSAGSRT